MSIKKLVPTNVYVSNVAPSARSGDMYLDTNLGRLRIYFENDWHDLAYVSDIGTSANSIFGGFYDTTLFADNLDGGYYNTSIFDAIIDAGALV
jgi:hypothetical protein